MIKNLTYMALGLSIGLIVSACAMGGNRLKYPERAMALKTWVFCRPAWGGNIVGNLCNRTRCGGKSCKKGEWKTKRINVCEKEGHDYFMNGGYIIRKREF